MTSFLRAEVVWFSVRAEETDSLKKHHFMSGYPAGESKFLLGKKCSKPDKKVKTWPLIPLRNQNTLHTKSHSQQGYSGKKPRKGNLQRCWEDKGTMEGRGKRLKGGDRDVNVVTFQGEDKEESVFVPAGLTSFTLSRSQRKLIGTSSKRKTDLHQLFQSTVTQPEQICKSNISKVKLNSQKCKGSIPYHWELGWFVWQCFLYCGT